MAFYSENVIQQLKAHADIAEIVQQFVPLKPSGSGRFVGRCPFHDDRKPSMSVNSTLGIYKCFACNAGGDVFRFVMEHEKTDFRSAVEWVANQTGFSLPALSANAEKKELVEERELVRELNSLALSWFEEQLSKNISAKNYLESRGISEETRAKFHLGFAPEGREGLLSFASKKGFSPKQLVRAGLAIEREIGGISDKFRNRLIIPIQNLSGVVVAFGGRTLGNLQNAPKYMNSPETALYTKGDTLFGFNHSRTEIAKAKDVIIVEGYFDLISLWQAGIRNVVAASGTALTDSHAAILSRYAQSAHLAFDGDAAGKKAARRSLEIVLSKSIIPKIFSLESPNGEKTDPDSFIREKGANAFIQALEKSRDWLDYLAHEMPHASPEDRSHFIREIKSIAATIQDKELSRQYLRLIADRYGTDTSLSGIRPKETAKKKNAENTPPALDTPKVPWALITSAEFRYLNLLLRNERALDAAAFFFDIQWALSGLSLFESPMLADLLATALLCKRDSENFSLRLLMNSLPPEHQEILMRLPEEEWNEASAEKEFLETTLDFERRTIDRLKRETDDIEFKLQLTQLSSLMKRTLVKAKQAKLSPNDIWEHIMNFRKNLMDFQQKLEGV